MSNNSNSTSTEVGTTVDLLVIYYPFTLLVAGTLFNFLTFLILLRPTFQDTHKRPTIHYMRAIALFDILMLYGWNLDHYLSYAFGFTLNRYSVPACKITSFINYFAPQASAWLRVFICLDRYLSLSRLHKTWFSESKHVLIIISCIITIATLINLHLIIFACFYKNDGSVNTNARFYSVYPLWDYVNLALYNLIPFVFMGIFNSGVIYHLIKLRKTSSIQHSKIHHRSISITLVITTCLFLIMTTPATIGFALLYKLLSSLILRVFDYALFTYHISSFPLYFATFTEFRREVIRLITCNKWRNTQPAPTATKITATNGEHNKH